MLIEPVTNQDVDRIANMYFELYCHVYKRPNSKRNKNKLRDYVKVRLEMNDYFIYKTLVRNRIIGTISLKRLSSKRGYITGAFVEPDYRRKGIARALEEFAVIELKNRGVSKVELDVRSDNDEGLSTWKSLGYKLKKKIPGKNADKLIMIKEIDRLLF